MTNDKPFEIILDSYSHECFHLFGVIKSLFDYSSIDEQGQDYPNYDGKLYASAFTYICSKFLSQYVDGYYPHEDFELFVEEMNFEEDRDFLIKDAKEINYDFNGDFDQLVHVLITHYRSQITNDIKTIFKTEQQQISLFYSVFKMGVQDEYVPFADYYNADFLN
jgi:hypothetical protein